RKTTSTAIKLIHDLDTLNQRGEQRLRPLNSFMIFRKYLDERSFVDCVENSEERSLGKSWEFYDPSINELLDLMQYALTHALCEYDTSTQSYQRPEFLGDTVLDMVVMAVIATHPGNGPGTNDIAQTFHRERQPP
ncbi:unnamed protein product, partial [Penicillium palitans]